MSDPATPTPPGSAKSARETIKAHVEALELWARRLSPGHPDDVFSRLLHHPSWSDEVHRVASTAGPLRALLDAPTGSVERLCEACDALDNAGLVQRFMRTFRDEEMPREAYKAWRSALAAVRASPEAVGAGASSEEATRLNDAAMALIRATGAPIQGSVANGIDVLVAERDALKADLEKAWQTEADLRSLEKTAWKRLDEAHAEIMRLRADRDRAAMPTTANASAPPPPAPPPASEGAVSERARLLYDGAMHYIATTAAAGLQDGPEDCARIARRTLEECERAAKGEGGKA